MAAGPAVPDPEMQALPCADDGFLPRLRRSAEFRSIRRRLVEQNPTDTWLEDGLHFFVFTLTAGAQLDYTPFDPPQAVFVFDDATRSMGSAVVVESPTPAADPQVIDLRASRRAWRDRLDGVRRRAASVWSRPSAAIHTQ